WQRSDGECARSLCKGERGARDSDQAAPGWRNRRAQRLDQLARTGVFRPPGLPEIGRILPRPRHWHGTRTLCAQTRNRTARRVHFNNLFYADIAKESYAEFKRQKNTGNIPVGTKFQVDLVPAHSVIWLFLVDALHAAIDPIYNDSLKREIDK